MSGAEASRASRNKGAEDFSERLVTLNEPDGIPSEAYRTLRTSLLYSLIERPPRVIMLTSPSPREGKSTTCANLGVTLSQAGKKALIIDCDLRKPVMHKVFGFRNNRGVVNAVSGDVQPEDLEELFHEVKQDLKLLPSGPVPTNPAELVGSASFATLLSRMSDEFDYVLLDAPPVQAVSDPAIIAAQCDGVLLVIDAQHTRKRAVLRSIGSLETVGATVLGTVMNNVRVSDSGYYGYDYGYSA